MPLRRQSRIAVIGSSGGSALAAALECLSSAGYCPELTIIVDRRCGMADWGEQSGWAVKHIDYTNTAAFSLAAATAAKAAAAEAVLLFYTRRVGADLYANLPTFNIHPSILPAYPGLRAIDDTLAAQARVLGATLHLVTEGIDEGPIVAQISNGLPIPTTTEIAQKISFLQKTYLTILWFDLLHDDALLANPADGSITLQPPLEPCLNASPSVRDSCLKASFESLQRRERCRVVAPPEASAE